MQTVIEQITSRLLSSDAVMQRVRNTAGRGVLHKTASPILTTGGSNEVTIQSALRALGRKLYVKKAEWRMVHAGLAALAEIEEGS